jgi:gliding motility associated protien GldN
MRNLRIFLTIIIASIAMGGYLFGQAVGGKVEVYEKTHIPKKEPVPYKFTREADVYWSKTIWRILDLKEKMNLPLYYPTDEAVGRPNLVRLITESLRTEGTKVYDATPALGEFTSEISRDEVLSSLGAGKDSTLRDDGTWKYQDKELDWSNVSKLMIKELWFFNKQYSSMDVRIIGLCPIRVYTKPSSNPTDSSAEELIQSKLYWVYYPDVRRLLSQNFVYNAKNDAQNISFDDLFTQRRFSSYIVRESNAYNDRLITQYAEGMDVLYESERIKESIMNWEHDLWEY